jgi:gamma-butyrobetaine dioxygenase
VLTYNLAEGDALIFDNRRLVHGRTAFRYMTEEERRRSGREGDADEPDRWLKGCYLGADAVMDRVRVLKTRFALEKAKGA